MAIAECRERLREASARVGLGPMADGAKLHRASLVFASGAPLGAESSALVPCAVSIELLHLASLVHDDIIDEATERRGLPALHVTEGHDRALVIGDLLIVSAFEELSGFPEAIARLSEGARLCCAGQLEELDDRPLSEEQYLDVAAKKTGALFSTAAALGALTARAGEAESAALASFGTALGIAYQVLDDLHDGARFSPTDATRERAIHSVVGALGRVPPPCVDPLRTLAETMGVATAGAAAVASPDVFSPP